ncbi:MAG: metallophosphoesterase, partial [bacterium]
MKKSYRFFCVSLLILLQAQLAHSLNTQERYFSNLFLSREPLVQIAPDGRLIVTVETKETCHGGEAFFGVIPDAAELPIPFYRWSAKLESLQPNQLEFSFDLKELTGKRVDINLIKDVKWQNIPYRLSLFGDELHTFDRNFGFVIDDAGNYFRIPAIEEGPFVDIVTPTSAVLSWDFDHAVRGALTITEQAAIPFSIQDTHHEIIVSDLQPNHEYSYHISWETSYGSLKTRTYHFRTAPASGSDKAFRFAVFSDTRATIGQGDRSTEHVNTLALRQLTGIAYHQNADFIIIAGDLVSGYISDPAEIALQFRAFKRVAGAVGAYIPIYEGLGNHDLPCRFIGKKMEDGFIPRLGKEAGESVFAAHFVNPENGPEPALPDHSPYKENVYSFDWGSAHLVSLNNDYMKKSSNAGTEDKIGYRNGWITAEQLDWLVKDLRDARDRGLKQLFVYLHEPAFPNGGHVKDSMWWDGKIPEMVTMRNCFWKILSDHNVCAVFCGHEHNFSLTLIDDSIAPSFTNPVWQVVTGGGGAPFYSQNSETPWAHNVEYFYPLTHLCLVDVDGDDVILHLIADDG